MPLKAAFSEGYNESLLTSKQGISLSKQGILITAFGPNPDDAGLLLRIWEQAGNTCLIAR